jgi:hypothetical protein
MMRRLIVMLFITTGLAGLAAADDREPGDDGLVPMFDGKTFEGWKKVGGGATYEIVGDTIVGKVGPGSNTFLRTEKTYGDFILKLDLKLDIPGNSGIQFRSHQQPSSDGNGRVFGYQCEVDPSARAWSGGLYDEARRGWLYPLEGHPAAQKAFKVSDWNNYTIMACGPHLRTWLNGVPCADLIDTMDLEGFIALQVHAGKEGQICWRNVRLKDLGQSTWKPLCDGKTLAGLSTRGGDWKIEDGTIHGSQSRTATEDGLLVTDNRYGDFAIRLKFKEKAGHIGLRLLTDDRVHRWNHSETHQPAQPASKKAAPKAIEPQDGWHWLAGVALGDRLIVQINGLTIVEAQSDPGRTPGRIAVALPVGEDVDIVVKDLEILPLNDDRCR